jgi:5'-phosphate synthase pdxT subunit
VKVGILAVQGAFGAHRTRLTELGAATTLVRTPSDLDGVDALVMPGGESTTMSKLLASSGLFEELERAIGDGLPTFGTCAGLILLAAGVDNATPDQRSLGVLDVRVSRNAYGRQLDSFEADVELAGSTSPFHAVFIRAPAIEAVGSDVDVLATLEDRPVLVRQESIMAAAFHPELTADTRLHSAFLELVEDRRTGCRTTSV